MRSVSEYPCPHDWSLMHIFFTLGVSGKAVSGPIRPSVYQFGSPPVAHQYHQIFHPFASAIFPMPADGSHVMDIVRRVYLDKSPETKLKQCTR